MKLLTMCRRRGRGPWGRSMSIQMYSQRAVVGAEGADEEAEEGSVVGQGAGSSMQVS
jgi:hypothetical protein